MLKVLDLFSGIGGFSLGLERAGMETIAFCEFDGAARKVLEKHWPNVPIYNDVRELSYERLQADGLYGIDIICGGFPCQDLSCAGSKKGISGERSGLWGEYKRLISEIRPRFAIMENVANLLIGDGGSWGRAFFGDLAEIGYDAEWHIISASSIGAPHIRERIWILAYPNSERRSSIFRRSSEKFRNLAHDKPVGSLFDWNGFRYERSRKKITFASLCKPPICRVNDGVPGRVDRLKQLGNSVVPQIPELIGRAILEAEEP
jgi:DNA (cytosine-5)-methyltransferase 1